MLHKFCFVASCLWFTTVFFGCAVPLTKLTPVTDDPDVDVLYINGNKAALSVKEKSTAFAFGYFDSKSMELKLLVGFGHRIDRVDVILEEIGIVAHTPQGNRVFLRVYPPDQYIVDRHNQQQLNLFVQAVAGELSAQQAGLSTTAVSGHYGGQSLSGTIETHDGAAVNSARAQNAAALERMAKSYAQSNRTLGNRLLQSHTLFDHEPIIAGAVIVKFNKGGFPAGTQFEIKIPWVEDEEHKITLMSNTSLVHKDPENAMLAGCLVASISLGAILLMIEISK